MTTAWVLGGGGLLGSALSRILRRDGTELFAPSRRVDWSCEPDLAAEFSAAAKAFAARAALAGQWEIYWAAGRGMMNSSEAELETETRVVAAFLGALESTRELFATRGALAYASSAGAIYAGGTDFVTTELSAPAPTTAYARAKLRQEEMLRSFASKKDGLTTLAARLSTVYGPGQAPGKRQGLLTHVARSTIMNLPVHIYVPLDTIRDYIFSDDAAAAMIAALRTSGGRERNRMKIIGSERPATIAEIIATFRRVARRAPRVITGASRLGVVYPRRTRYRSVVEPDVASLPKTTLLVGVARVMAAERAAVMRGARLGEPASSG
jgi:UDP-glucose 4-epimerase